MSKVSVVIPVKDSGADIRTCVESLLDQDHPDFEVIVVGDQDDTSWPALETVRSGRLVRVPVRVTMNGATRDANLKRRIGLSLASGDVLALTDSDMVLRPGWMAEGVALLEEHDVVASTMVSSADGFLGGYIDTNVLGSRTPRYTEACTLAADNFGRPGHKPPVTANLFLRRAVLDATGGPSASFTRSYEDYEWARRIVDAGFRILCTSALAGHHDHRTHPRQILRDYRRSGRGCADYVVTHPRCTFARARLRQSALIAAAVPVVLLALALSAPATLAAGASAATALMLWSWGRVRTPAALVYPWVTLVLGLTFWVGLVGQLVRNRPRLRWLRVQLPQPVGGPASPLVGLVGPPAGRDVTALSGADQASG